MRSGRCFVLSLIVGVFVVLVGEAQMPVPPTAPNPQSPVLAMPLPMGMQRGTTLDLTLTGSNLAEPVNVLTSFPATVTIPTENNNGKENSKLLVRFEVPANALLGWHTIRLATTRGVSNTRMFCLDDLPQLLETETNRSVTTAQAVSLPCVVCGRTDPEIIDYFKFTVQAGQRLSFEVLGRRLGSELDPLISLINPRTGKQLAFADDAPGQGKDPRLTFTFPEAGEYVLELRDVRHMGGPNWYYRLRIGDFPCATTPVPLAVKRGSLTQVSFAGPNVEGVAPVPVLAPQELQANTIQVWPISVAGLAGWPVSLEISDLDELLEAEPNDEPAKANRLRIPAALSARLLKKGDKDHFVFTAKKGQRIIIEAQTQEAHSPTSVYMTLKNSAGQDVATSNPNVDPAQIDFTAPADGDWTLAVEHLHYWGGPEESYRLSLLPYEPGFTLTAGIDRFDMAQGAGSVLAVHAVRRDYNGPIEVRVAEPIGITGTATIAAGQTSTLMTLNAPADMAIGGHRLRLVGKATINNKVVIRNADLTEVVTRELSGLVYPPRHLATQLAVGITPKPPFTLEAKFDYPEGVRGAGVPVTVTAMKAPGFDEDITIAAVRLPQPPGQPPLVPPATVKIPKGKTEAKLVLRPAANIPLGQSPLGITGKTKFANRDYLVAVPVMQLTLASPFNLQVDTVGGHIAIGEKHKIKVKALRRGGYNGPITLEVRNLPANVTAPKVTIPENQTEAEVELTAAASAAPGPKLDVNVNGTATAAGNQQSASGNFALSVVKK